MITPRPYQAEAVEATEQAWARGVRRPALVMATGLGKTIVFALAARRFLERTGQRVIVLAHRTELTDQARGKLATVMPNQAIGLVKGNANQTLANIVVASTPTLFSDNRRRQLLNVGLVIADECFPAGTMVGTPIGSRPIEDFRSGDLVASYSEATGGLGARRVVAPMRRRPAGMVRVTLTDGESFACTPNHPMMTPSGWKPAGELRNGEPVLSFTHDNAARSDLLGVFGEGRADRQVGDRYVPPPRGGVLLESLREGPSLADTFGDDGADESRVRVGANDRAESHAPRRAPEQDGRDIAQGRASAARSRWEREAGRRTTATASGISGVADRGDDPDRERDTSILVQYGHCAPIDESRDRGGRRVPLLAGAPRVRRTEGNTPAWKRVARVQVLEPGRDGTYGGVCPDGFVYNIEVEGTHTYLIGSGLVAHNCHHYAAPRYREVLEHFAEQGALLLGVTATMSRGDNRSLGEIWDEVVFQRDIRFGQQHGFLVKARGKRVRIDDLDLSTVRRTASGDYEKESLGDALTASLAPKRIAEALTEHAPAGRTVAFAPSIASAEAIAADVAAAGFTTATVHHKTPAKDRRRILLAHEAGDLQVVSNAMVLTEGWDNPACDTAVIARQTNSSALYQQMVGRVLRPSFGKTGALILDVVGAAERHTLQAQIDLFGPEYEEPEEREPCMCGGIDPGYCSCSRDRCTPACSCTGGKACSCVWAELLELDTGEQGTLHADGRLITEDVDLFHGSENAWLTTTGGTHFLAVGDRFVAILPGDDIGTWDVVSTNRYVPRTQSRWIMRACADLGFAQAYAEGDVTPAERRTARKDRTWRAVAPSVHQIRYATTHRIPIDPWATAGELNNTISIIEASHRLDPAAAALRMKWNIS